VTGGGAGDPPDVGEAYERAACGLLTLDPAGAIESVSATLCAWTGFPASELIGRSFPSLLSMGSKLFHQTHWSPLLELQGSVAEVQLELLHRDGRVLPVLVNAARRPPVEGRRARVDIAVFIATDRRKYERELILARKRAEELAQRARGAENALRQREIEFRTLTENSPDVIVRFDAARRVTYASPAIRRFTARPTDAFLGRRLDETRIDPAIVAAWSAALDEAFAGRPATLSLGYPALDGTVRELQSHIVPEPNLAGEVVTVLGISRDVTLLRQQEVEAQQRAILAEQLIGIVSHDLRNPLNAVMLAAELLGDSELGENAQTVRRITASAARANRLIGDLLDFTQARLGGGLRVARRPLDLHAVVAECLDEVRMAAPGRAIVHRRVGEGGGRGDADRLAQVLTNLVNNALVYGTPTEPVTVTTVVAEATLEIEVHNAGPPIPDELRPHMFEPLRRGEQQMQLGSRSVGLGLYIVSEIAAAHGGRITLRSTAAEGTTFVVSVPRG
jgi:sigma-B regulation protein RsbU (phosphoserine phosphatase)